MIVATQRNSENFTEGVKPMIRRLESELFDSILSVVQTDVSVQDPREDFRYDPSGIQHDPVEFLDWYWWYPSSIFGMIPAESRHHPLGIFAMIPAESLHRPVGIFAIIPEESRHHSIGIFGIIPAESRHHLVGIVGNDSVVSRSILSGIFSKIPMVPDTISVGLSECSHKYLETILAGIFGRIPAGVRHDSGQNSGMIYAEF